MRRYLSSLSLFMINFSMLQNVIINGKKIVIFEKCNVALEISFFMYGKVTRAW